MPIFMTARFEVKPESLARCREAITDFVAHIQANEPGTLEYRSLGEREAPTRFLHVMQFADAEARTRHSSSAAVKKFVDLLYPECLAPVEFTEYEQLAGKRA